MASDRTSTMRSPYDNSAIIATKRRKGASSRKLTVGKRVANARPFETVLRLPRNVMPTLISIDFFIFQSVGGTGVRSSFCLYINNGMYVGLLWNFSRIVK